MSLKELDPEDVDLVTLLATGMTDDEVATRLHITIGAVQRRTARLLVRLGLASKSELISAVALDVI